MYAWEYRTVTFGGVLKNVKTEDVEPALNELGKEGWEAVGMTGLENTGKVLVLLKRRVVGPGGRPSGDVWGRW